MLASNWRTWSGGIARGIDDIDQLATVGTAAAKSNFVLPR